MRDALSPIKDRAWRLAPDAHPSAADLRSVTESTDPAGRRYRRRKRAAFAIEHATRPYWDYLISPRQARPRGALQALAGLLGTPVAYGEDIANLLLCAILGHVPFLHGPGDDRDAACAYCDTTTPNRLPRPA